ncbi:hypothetical protein BC833DRAFT_534396 [Globomyces pollinis-pini]|nr:hypothetical protein BC833DRAFT_534396 [Globomyces pollinis-pini]
MTLTFFRTIHPTIHSSIFNQFRLKTSYINVPKRTTQISPLLNEITPELAEVNLKDPFLFAVQRKSSGMLPIYRQYKNGRTRTITVIRNIKGNTNHFVQLLSTVIPSDRIRLIGTGSSIQIVGDYFWELRKWLTLHKF